MSPLVTLVQTVLQETGLRTITCLGLARDSDQACLLGEDAPPEMLYELSKLTGPAIGFRMRLAGATISKAPACRLRKI